MSQLWMGFSRVDLHGTLPGPLWPMTPVDACMLESRAIEGATMGKPML